MEKCGQRDIGYGKMDHMDNDNGKKILIGWDWWIGCDGKHNLLVDLVEFINSHGFYYIADVARDEPIDVDNKVWAFAQDL